MPEAQLPAPGNGAGRRETAGWHSLLPQLLEDTGLLLEAPNDVAAARAVCRHWRAHVTARLASDGHRELPLVSLHPDVHRFQEMLAAVAACLPRLHSCQVNLSARVPDEVTDQEIGMLTQLAHLTHLEISGVLVPRRPRLGTAPAKSPLSLTLPPHLRLLRLALKGRPAELNAAHLVGLTGLRQLHICHSDSGFYPNVSHFAALSTLTGLRCMTLPLRVKTGDMMESELQGLVALLGQLTSLQEFHLPRYFLYEVGLPTLIAASRSLIHLSCGLVLYPDPSHPHDPPSLLPASCNAPGSPGNPLLSVKLLMPSLDPATAQQVQYVHQVLAALSSNLRQARIRAIVEGCNVHDDPAAPVSPIQALTSWCRAAPHLHITRIHAHILSKAPTPPDAEPAAAPPLPAPQDQATPIPQAPGSQPAAHQPDHLQHDGMVSSLHHQRQHATAQLLDVIACLSTVELQLPPLPPSSAGPSDARSDANPASKFHLTAIHLDVDSFAASSSSSATPTAITFPLNLRPFTHLQDLSFRFLSMQHRPTPGNGPHQVECVPIMSTAATLNLGLLPTSLTTLRVDCATVSMAPLLAPASSPWPTCPVAASAAAPPTSAPTVHLPGSAAPAFPMLRKLYLQSNHYDSSFSLPLLLERCPRLVTLCINLAAIAHRGHAATGGLPGLAGPAQGAAAEASTRPAGGACSSANKAAAGTGTAAGAAPDSPHRSRRIAAQGRRVASAADHANSRATGSKERVGGSNAAEEQRASMELLQACSGLTYLNLHARGQQADNPSRMGQEDAARVALGWVAGLRGLRQLELDLGSASKACQLPVTQAVQQLTNLHLSAQGLGIDRPEALLATLPLASTERRFY